MIFKSLGKRCLSFICALVITLVIIPVLSGESNKAFAIPNSSSQTVGPGSGYSVTYFGEAGLTIEASKNDEIFRSKVTYTSTKSGNGYLYKIKVPYNSTSKNRNGLLLVKKKGSIVYRINVAQEGIYLNVEPEFKRDIINGNGQVINYTVTTNVQVKVYHNGESNTGAKGFIQSLGSDQTAANKKTTHKISVSYPANNLNRWRPMAIGVIFVSGQVTKCFMYEQASTRNDKHGYSSKHPLGTIRHNGYDYRITTTDVENDGNYHEVDTVQKTKIDAIPAFAGFNIPSGSEAWGNQAVSLLSGIISAIQCAERYDVTFKYYQNNNNWDDRVVQILVNDYQISLEVDNPRSRPIKQMVNGKMCEIRYDESRTYNDDLQLTLDEDGNWVESFRDLGNEYIKYDGKILTFDIPRYIPKNNGGEIIYSSYSTPFPLLNINDDVRKLANQALAD